MYRQMSFRDGGKIAAVVAGADEAGTLETDTAETGEPLILWQEIDSETKALWVDRKTGEVLKEKTSVFNKSEPRSEVTAAKPAIPFSKTDQQVRPHPLKIAAKVEKHHISRDAIDGAHQKFCALLGEGGLIITNLKPIRIDQY